MKKTFITLMTMMLGITATAQITSQPEGEVLKNMEYCSKGMVPDYATQQITQFDEKGVIAHVVRNGRKFYVQDPITHYRKGVWFEGELSEDGTQVVFHTPQVFTQEQGVTYYLYRLAQSGQRLALDPQNTDLVFSYADGTLKQTDGGYLSITDVQGRTTSYVEHSITIRPVEGEVLCPPAEATHASYKMSYESEGAPQTQTIEVAFSGSQVFIANPSGTAGSWIHGTIDGDRIVCPNRQFIGPDESLGYYAYMTAALGTIEIVNIPGFGDWPVSSINLTDDEAIVFTWNAEERTFSTEQLFLINAASDKLTDHYRDYAKAAFAPYAEMAAVPADPRVISYSGFIAEYGLGVFAIDMPATDVEGNYINQENMYYNVYVDDRQLQTADGKTDIPYNYTDGQTIRVSGTSHTFTCATPINDRIGVQVFYRVGDVVNHSNLIWYNISTEGLNDVARPALSIQQDYDLQGRHVNAGAKGLHIRRTTLPDGTVVTRKALTR